MESREGTKTLKTNFILPHDIVFQFRFFFFFFLLLLYFKINFDISYILCFTAWLVNINNSVEALLICWQHASHVKIYAFSISDIKMVR